MRLTSVTQCRRTVLHLSLALVCTGLVIAAGAQEVSIPDPGLNAAVREALQKPSGPLTEQDLLSLTNLDASRRNVRSTDGLEAARNLVSLNLEINRLTNFSLPSGMTKLVFLDVSINPLVSFALPDGLTNLAFLNLSLNRLTNLVLPPDLFHLESLLLGGNQLASLNLPAGLTNLSGLFLAANQLTSLTLPPDIGAALEALSFLDNPLTTLVLSEPLAASTNLIANATESVATLPDQGVSVFTYPLTVQLVRLQQPLGTFQFGISGPPGIYTVLASPDLAVWNELGVTTNQLGAIVFTDGTAHLSPQKFYWVRSP